MLKFGLQTALVLACVGEVCALTVKDRHFLTAVLFYASPWLVRLIVAALALFWLRRVPRGLAAILLLIALSDGFKAFAPGRPERDPLPGSFTIACWNAGRTLDDHPDQWHFTSDIVAIIESGSFDEAEWRAFTAATPAYEWHRFDGGTMLGVMGSMDEFNNLGEHDLFRCFRTSATPCGASELSVVVVDMRSQPWLSREEPMRRIFAAAEPDEAAVILGDFNTPPGSHWIEKNTSGRWKLANLFQTDGFVETWPYVFPVHCLDQIWVSPRLKPIRVRQELRCSDHQLVEATLSPDP